jgi:hypothetical protein
MPLVGGIEGVVGCKFDKNADLVVFTAEHDSIFHSEKCERVTAR